MGVIMKKFDRQELPLKLVRWRSDGHCVFYKNLFYNRCQLQRLKEEMISFIEENKYEIPRNLTIATLYEQGIKYNNTLEGYLDDLCFINNIIANIDVSNVPSEKVQRVTNFYSGYKYILNKLNKSDINKKNLRELYNILSYNLLDEKDAIEPMGEYYRQGPVVVQSRCEGEEDCEKTDSILVDGLMDDLFIFSNDKSFTDCNVDHYIKSQISHFYIVHVHPYYDINKRTARTFSMWQLLQNKADSFLLFNRGLLIDRQRYYRIIKDVEKFGNISFFLNYMLKTIKSEIEKEVIINTIDKEIKIKLDCIERQSIYNFLSFKTPNTFLNFTDIYNRFNPKKRPLEVYREMIVPLVEKGVFTIERPTSKNIDSNIPNHFFAINDEKLGLNDSLNPAQVKKYIKK